MVASGVLSLTSDGDSVMDGLAALTRGWEMIDDRVRGCKDMRLVCPVGFGQGRRCLPVVCQFNPTVRGGDINGKGGSAAKILFCLYIFCGSSKYTNE